MRNKPFLLINIFGLSIGLTTFLLIALFIQYELNWDRFHEKSNRIYRLQTQAHLANGDQYWNQVGFPFGIKLKEMYGEIEDVVVTRPVWGEFLSTSEKLTFYEERGLYAQQSYFDVFTVKFTEGSPESALIEPYSILLSESLRQKYFGDEKALGKFIKSNNRYELKVTGVYEDYPENSSLEADYISPIQLIEINYGGTLNEQWDNFSFFTYLLVNYKANLDILKNKVASFLSEAEQMKNNGTKYTLWLNPLVKVHLVPDPASQGFITIVYLFSFVGVFALLLASINFMNLTTAYSANRAKEIAIKKVVGSSRISLGIQFIFESLLISFLSLIIALFLTELVLPYFSSVVSRHLDLDFVGNWRFFILVLGITTLTGFLSGSYPAFYLSKFNPVKALKSSAAFANAKSPLRKILVTVQFVISSMLILSTLVIYKQFDYMKNKDLGFDKEQVIYAGINPEKNGLSRKFEIIQTKLGQVSGVVHSTVSFNIPFLGSSGTNLQWEGAEPEQTINSRYNFVGYDFIETFGLQIIQGRNFSRDIASDSVEACIINETATATFNWDNAVGKKITFWGKDYYVIGVVKDFHPFSVFQHIPPYFMRLHNENIDGEMIHSIRVTGGANILKVRDEVSSVYKEFFPHSPFEFNLLSENKDDAVWNIYMGIVKTFLFFSIVTISIAIFGLFGLVAFTTKSRTKEIGIRKIHGASSSQVYFLLVKEFTVIIIIAIILAFPVAFGFRAIDPAAYKPDLSWWEFASTATIVLLVTIFTILYHTIRASKQNAAESLRYE